MWSSEYCVKYICPKCDHSTNISHYGTKSDMIEILKHIDSSILCSKCMLLNKRSKMDIENVKCKTHSEDVISYNVYWGCRECGSEWRTYEHIKKGASIKDLVGNQSCINSICIQKNKIYVTQVKSALV